MLQRLILESFQCNLPMYPLPMVTGNKMWALRGMEHYQLSVGICDYTLVLCDRYFFPFIVTAILFYSSSHRSATISSLHDVETFYSPADFTVCPTSVLVSNHWGIHCSRAEDAHGEFTSIGISMYRDCLRNCREVATPWLVVVRGLNAREERGFGWWWRVKKLLLSLPCPIQGHECQ